jgi:integrase
VSNLPELPTFQELAESWLQLYSARQHKPEWHRRVTRILRRNVLPHLGALPAEQITRKEVARVVSRRMEVGKGATANHVLVTIRGVFDWAVQSGRIDCANPTLGIKRAKLKPRERVLSEGELRLIWRACEGMGDYTRILRLLMLIPSRRAEIGSLLWSEINLEKKQIELPGSRTKNERPHVIPLTDAAIALLPQRRDGYPHLFGRVHGRGFNGWSNCKALLDGMLGVLGRGIAHWTHHDLRRSCATHMAELLGVPDEVIGRTLGHAPQGVTRKVYNRSERLGEQRAALESWALKLEEIVRRERSEPKAA